MWEKLRVVFTIPELRNKIFLTLALLAVYRVGFWITLPMFDKSQINQQSSSSGLAGMVERVAVFSASDLQQATIFGLGIMPYISASIILQLMGEVYGPLKELRKEGEAGRKKINEWTRYLTVVLCLFQSYMYLKFYLLDAPPGQRPMLVDKEFLSASGLSMYWGWQLVAVLTMTAGTLFLMWLGEQIDEYGIGNGISLLIMAGILARMPKAGLDVLGNTEWRLTGGAMGEIGVETMIIMVALFVAVVAGVVYITLGQRRIPTQSAKHVRGRRVFGGTRQYLPLRINQAGVMPIIFASSLLMLLPMLFNAVSPLGGDKWKDWMGYFASATGGYTSFTHNLLYVMLIYFFCYFWVAITFNPKEISENLKDNGTFIPGYRPGKRTAEYLEKVIARITYVGAAFLALVAIVPMLVTEWLGIPAEAASFYGGTGLLIAVSVAFDLVQKIDNHLIMRNYRGLLES